MTNILNKDTIKFLSRNGVDINELLTSVDCNIYNPGDINGLVAKNGFYSESVRANISIADIVGYENYGEKEDIFSSFRKYFDSNGDGYHVRSIGMLEYSSDEVMEKLRYSFEEEPMCVQEIDNGKYVISTNGMHRYTVLRSHYLIELQKANGDSEEIERLKEKYTIPVQMRKVDFLKTYSKFLIGCDNRKYSIYSELDENYNYTGNVEIYLGDEKRVLNDSELIEFAKNSLLNLSENQREIIDFLASEYESFNRFMLQNFADEMRYNQNMDSEKVR